MSTTQVPAKQQVVPNILSEEQLKAVLPEKMKKSLNKELMHNINSRLSDPMMAIALRDNIIGFTAVLNEGRFKIKDYISAVIYASHKLKGDTNMQAYIRTFPDRYQYFIDNQVDPKEQSAHVAMYNKGKLVNLVMEQTMVPFHVLNQDMYQKALNTQAELMTTAKSEKVRTDAADSILKHLKPPEAAKMEIEVKNTEATSAIDELRRATEKLNATQREAIKSGRANAEEIAHATIIEHEDVE